MAIPDPPIWYPAVVDLTPTPESALPVAAWMLTFYAADVPDDALPWLLAQGWQIVSIRYDNTTTPPTPYYDLTREGMANSAVLQSLVNVYTRVYNEGRLINDLRYENIVANWSSMVSAMTTHVTAMATTSNVFASIWLGRLDAVMAEVETDVLVNKTDLQTYADDLWTKVDGLSAQLSTLTTYYTATAANIETIITAESAALVSYMADHDVKLTEMETQLTVYTTSIETDLAATITSLNTFITDIEAQLALLETEREFHRLNVEAVLAAEAQSLAQYLAAATTQLQTMDTGHADHRASIQAVITTELATLATYLSEYGTAIASLVSDTANHVAAARNIEATAEGYLVTHVAAYEVQLATLLADYTAHLGTVNTLLTSADAAFTSYEASTTALLATVLADYTNHDATVLALLTESDANFSSHQTDYQAVLVLLETDWTAHAATTTTLLDGLGVTETARINEQFDNLSSQQYQALVDRGLYSSGLITAFQVQVSRERGEALGILNDRLNREKVDDEHKLYEQLTGVRGRTLEGKDRLYSLDQAALQYRAESIVRSHGQLQDVRNRTLAAEQSLVTLQEEVIRYQITVREGLATRLEGVRVRTMEGLDRIQQLQDALQRWLSDDQHKIYAEQAGLDAHRIEQAERQQAGRMGVYGAEVAQRDALVGRLLQESQLMLSGLLEERQAEGFVDQQAEAFQTRLFGAIQAVYGRYLDEIDRKAGMGIDVYRGEAAARQALLQTTETVHGQIADSITRQHESQQSVEKAEAAQRDALLSQALVSAQGVIAGQAQANQLRQANGEFLTNGTYRLAALLIENRLNELRLKADRNAQEMELMKYQADASNNLIVGLFGFQEKREDTYPSLDLITQLVSQLGDSGATSWVSP